MSTLLEMPTMTLSLTVLLTAHHGCFQLYSHQSNELDSGGKRTQIPAPCGKVQSESYFSRTSLNGSAGLRRHICASFLTEQMKKVKCINDIAHKIQHHSPFTNSLNAGLRYKWATKSTDWSSNDTNQLESRRR